MRPAPHRLGRPVIAALALALGGAAAGCGGTIASAPAGSAPQPATTAARQSPPATVATANAGAVTAPTTGTTAPAASSGTQPATPPAASQPLLPPRPHIVNDPIPFPAKRKAEMVAYARRHYGSFMTPTYRLVNPHVIVIHFSETPDFSSTFNTFAPDIPDSELHELPNTCAHFVIDRDGTIHQLVPLGIMCRHTVGLNWTAIGIEHVGYSDGEVLGDRNQMRASLALVRWLRCRFHIPVGDVIGHNESLSSPFHREDVPSLRGQTHSDFNRPDMQLYRARLRAAGGC